MGVVVLIAVTVLAIALVPHNVQAQSSNQNMRALIQAFVDNGQTFTISGLTGDFDVDGSSVTVSDLGDDFVCVSGSGVTYRMQPVQKLCSPFSVIAILIR
jgi:hypothetical protein